jgi:hypothetical protein
VKAGARFCICYKEVIPWVMFPLQIAYVTDENIHSSGRKRAAKDGGIFAFGSGTLQGHLLVQSISPSPIQCACWEELQMV